MTVTILNNFYHPIPKISCPFAIISHSYQWNHYFAFCPYSFIYSEHCIQMYMYTISSFLSATFHLAECFCLFMLKRRRQWQPTPVLSHGRYPGRLQSMGSLGVWHDWATSLSLFTFMHWRRKWQPTPVFLPGESQGWGSLVGCRPWDEAT